MRHPVRGLLIGSLVAPVACWLAGLDVVCSMRAIPRHAAVPAVAVSAYGTEEDQRETFGAGFPGHLVKPVD